MIAPWSAVLRPLASAALILSVFSSRTALAETDAATLAAAEKEGRVVVYSVTSSLQALIDDFKAAFPRVQLDYVTMDTIPLHDRVIAEATSETPGDVIWSSAMDLQMKLVLDGHAMTYASKEEKALPEWAVWRHQAFGTTFEPVAIVYNKRLLDAGKIPRNRSEFVDRLRVHGALFQGKVVAFDPEKSGLGFLLMTQDDAVSPGFWPLISAMGRAQVRPQSGSGAMFQRIASGEALIGYNLLGSYARARAANDLPDLGLVLPSDYTLVMTRIMFINRRTRHPNAARLWVDYVLSKRGQQSIAAAHLGALRNDVPGDTNRAALEKALGSALKPIKVRPELIDALDPAKRHAFLEKWRLALAADVKP